MAERPAERAPGKRGPGRVGLWEPEHVDGAVEFARSAVRAGEWRFWADVDRIPAKRGPRVVLLGESAARGYFYDPAVTPAGVLEAMLNAMPGLEGADVVDLARTDITAEQLRRLFDALAGLEPDAVVLFAGNNWHSVLFKPEELSKHHDELADAVREGGFAAMRRVAVERIVLPHVRATLDAFAQSMERFRIPAVLIVPEFNLADWRSELEVVAPVLRDGANLPWMESRLEAEQAMAIGRLDEVEGHARRMIALDGGMSAYPQRLLADALLGLGRIDEARACLEASRDAPYGLLIPHSPRCPGEVQDTLRAKAVEHGFELIDLPRVFAERFGIPDRRLLLDYCHLTIDGLRIAMAATANALAPILGSVGLTPSELEALHIAVDPEDAAAAHLLAAIHNSHWGQSGEVVRHHGRQALEQAPAAAALLLAYLDAQSRYADLWLCEAYQRLTQSPNVRRYLVLKDPRVLPKLADFELVDLLVDELERKRIPARDHVESIIRAEHGRQRRVDLLASRYAVTTFRQEVDRLLRARPAYHRALDLTSCFSLVLDVPRPVRLTLTCRLPGGDGDVEIRVNGKTLGHVSTRHHWRTFQLALPAASLYPGVNRVELAWPLRALPSEELLERAARCLERGVYPEVLPGYGDVHTLEAVS